MPNGNYSLSREDWKGIRAFFEKHSATLSSFAAAHNLAIDEYYHDAPSWIFRFRHPKGGVGGVEVKRINESVVRVNLSWFVDEYENFTHHFKQEESRELSLADIELGEALEGSLIKLLAWNKEELTAHSAKYPWANYSKEEWERMWSADGFPSVKL